MPAKKLASHITIAYVRWFDSAIYNDPCQPEDLSGYCENESAGLLIAQDADKITLAVDRCLDTKEIRMVLCHLSRPCGLIPFSGPTRDATANRIPA